MRISGCIRLREKKNENEKERERESERETCAQTRYFLISNQSLSQRFGGMIFVHLFDLKSQKAKNVFSSENENEHFEAKIPQ